jgi:ATP-dependent DNA helicase Rep
MYVGITRAERSLEFSYCRTRRRGGERVDVTPSRFLAELAQDDLRHADAPPAAATTARERMAGAQRLKALKALVAR